MDMFLERMQLPLSDFSPQPNRFQPRQAWQDERLSSYACDAGKLSLGLLWQIRGIRVSTKASQ